MDTSAGKIATPDEAPVPVGPYLLSGVLGSGSYGTVYRGTGPNGSRVSVMVIDRGSPDDPAWLAGHHKHANDHGAPR